MAITFQELSAGVNEAIRKLKEVDERMGRDSSALKKEKETSDAVQNVPENIREEKFKDIMRILEHMKPKLQALEKVEKIKKT